MTPPLNASSPSSWNSRHTVRQSTRWGPTATWLSASDWSPRKRGTMVDDGKWAYGRPKLAGPPKTGGSSTLINKLVGS